MKATTALRIQRQFILFFELLPPILQKSSTALGSGG